ncbi:MAG: hypothetical protein FVQ80_10530 [Planctomycetes bacterium]|nr:hypothetical protein [Planctomycetota bacterium]
MRGLLFRSFLLLFSILILFSGNCKAEDVGEDSSQLSKAQVPKAQAGDGASQFPEVKAPGAQAGEDSSQLPNVRAMVIVCKGMIDDGLYKSIQRRTDIALAGGADYLIYEIQTYGGLVQSADDISKYLILDIGKKAKTVAYITSEAISAGAMISVSCHDIIMLENTKVGDAAPIMLGGKLEGVEREKQESFIRAIFKTAAQANDYPEALLEAMVSLQNEVYQVENIETGEYEYFEESKLPSDANGYDVAGKKMVVKAGELLTLTAGEAKEYGIARAVVDDQDGMLAYLAERDGVVFEGEPVVLRTNWSEEMVRWVNSPAVMGVLVMIALLGVYIELNTPGLGLPGLAAVICFVIIIGSKYLVGLANWVEVAFFAVGLILLLVEILVLPGFGIAGVSGIIFIMVGLFGMLTKNPPERLPWPETNWDWHIFTEGVLGLGIGFGGFIVLAWLLARYIPKLELLSGLILSPALAKKGDEVEVSMTAPPERETGGVNVGEIGEVLSELRPTGKVKFDSAIVDCVAEGEFIEKGAMVEIIEIHGNRVVVKGKSE